MDPEGLTQMYMILTLENGKMSAEVEVRSTEKLLAKMLEQTPGSNLEERRKLVAQYAADSARSTHTSATGEYKIDGDRLTTKTGRGPDQTGRFTLEGDTLQVEVNDRGMSGKNCPSGESKLIVYTRQK